MSNSGTSSQTQTLPACLRSTSTSCRRTGSPSALAIAASRSACSRSTSGYTTGSQQRSPAGRLVFGASSRSTAIYLQIPIEVTIVNVVASRRSFHGVVRGAAMEYVLFACNHNAGRSQRAQAFFERDAPSDVRAKSTGSEPARAVWPEVVEVRREGGIDLAARRPKKLLRGQPSRRSPEEIGACTDAILGRNDDAPVRSYVLTLAQRQTGDCLTAE